MQKRHRRGRRLRIPLAPVRAQNVIANIRRVAGKAGRRGDDHPRLVRRRTGAPGMTLNAPLFEGLVDSAQ
jgi:hypothetical protein